MSHARLYDTSRRILWFYSANTRLLWKIPVGMNLIYTIVQSSIIPITAIPYGTVLKFYHGGWHIGCIRDDIAVYGSSDSQAVHFINGSIISYLGGYVQDTWDVYVPLLKIQAPTYVEFTFYINSRTI